MCALQNWWEWWSVLGLGFDLVGFLLIVTEWRAAVGAVASNKLIERLEVEVGPEHFSRHLRESILDEIERNESRRAPSMTLAAIFIVGGLALQTIGNWPC